MSTELLKEHFAARVRNNKNYSLRAFARDLGINPGSLSAIMKGKRPLPPEHLPTIGKNLKLTPRKLKQLFSSSSSNLDTSRHSIPSDEKSMIIDERNFHILAEWEHYAILSLMETVDFQSDPKWMAQRLGVNQTQIELALQRLEEAGLIIKQILHPANKKPLSNPIAFEKTLSTKVHFQYQKKTLPLRTSEDVSSVALCKAHAEECDLAKLKIDVVTKELRDYSSTTMAINPKNIERAKKAIRNFRRELEVLLEDDEASEVYLLAIQLFPLTQLKTKD
jgi:transcriptional regulator with XRE-family HTH domain